MKSQRPFAAYLLIGIGIYFLLGQLDLPIFTTFYSWPTLLMIIGIALLLHSYSVRDYQSIFNGVLLLGVGIHFHGLNNYEGWIDHWAIFLLIIGIAFAFRSLQTRKGLVTGLILIALASFLIFSVTVPASFNWIYSIVDVLEKFWPVMIIILGIYLLKTKK